MKRALLAGLVFASVAAPATAQLVPLARCHAAYPCNVPYGLRPADAVANLPDAQLGNALVSVGVDNAFKPKLIASPVSGDPVEGAARLYLRKNPLGLRTPTPKPAATPAGARPAGASPDAQKPG